MSSHRVCRNNVERWRSNNRRRGSCGGGGSRSNRCFDSKLTSEKSLALKAVAPLHVVVAPHAVVATSGAWRYAAACTAARRQAQRIGAEQLLYFGTYSSY